jgi:hypothetical protein
MRLVGDQDPFHRHGAPLLDIGFGNRAHADPEKSIKAIGKIKVKESSGGCQRAAGFRPSAILLGPGSA